MSFVHIISAHGFKRKKNYRTLILGENLLALDDLVTPGALVSFFGIKAGVAKRILLHLEHFARLEGSLAIKALEA